MLRYEQLASEIAGTEIKMVMQVGSAANGVAYRINRVHGGDAPFGDGRLGMTKPEASRTLGAYNLVLADVVAEKRRELTLAEAVELFYAQNSGGLTPEGRRIMADAVKLIRASGNADAGSEGGLACFCDETGWVCSRHRNRNGE